MQSAMSSLPTSEFELEGQPSHADAAVMFWYVPTEHCEHVPEPLTSLNEPPAHAEHAAPSDPSNPTLHVQSAMLSLPISEFVLAGQLKQTDPSVLFKYVPAAHSMHLEEPL
eukprot:2130601-Rhodomonas_salina.1